MDSFIHERCKKATPKTHSNVFAPGTVTCVYGKPGIGKTFFVHKELPNHVAIDHTILKSKQGTIDFFERLRCTSSPVIVDNWESLVDLIGLREITGPISSGPLVLVSHTPVKLTPDTILYDMPVMTPDQLIALAPNHPRAQRLAHECQGDVRWFLQGLDYRSDARDVFKTPIELVEDLVTCPNPLKYLTETLHEYGYVASTVQENYTSAKGITIETCATLAESQSLADVYDDLMYRAGAWDTLMPYFLTAGCVVPATLLRRTLNPKHIRPGSTWSKFQNMCMRRKKIRETRLDADALRVIRTYVEHGHLELLREYKLTDAMVDVLNHIVVGHKLKPKLIEHAKKYVRSTAS
jgi:hypothetical protein